MVARSISLRKQCHWLLQPVGKRESRAKAAPLLLKPGKPHQGGLVDRVGRQGLGVAGRCEGVLAHAGKQLGEREQRLHVTCQRGHGAARIVWIDVSGREQFGRSCCQLWAAGVDRNRGQQHALGSLKLTGLKSRVSPLSNTTGWPWRRPDGCDRAAAASLGMLWSVSTVWGTSDEFSLGMWQAMHEPPDACASR